MRFHKSKLIDVLPLPLVRTANPNRIRSRPLRTQHMLKADHGLLQWGAGVPHLFITQQPEGYNSGSLALDGFYPCDEIF